jgi:hypothetical protein
MPQEPEPEPEPFWSFFHWGSGSCFFLLFLSYPAEKKNDKNRGKKLGGVKSRLK